VKAINLAGANFRKGVKSDRAMMTLGLAKEVEAVDQ
jgi:hypothetical protein